MEINLKDNQPVQKKYTSIPRPLYPEVKQYIEDLLNQNFITESKSPHSSPVVCVRKKDGSLRLCIDYRELNRKTIADRHPILESKKPWIVLVEKLGSVFLIRARHIIRDLYARKVEQPLHSLHLGDCMNGLGSHLD